MSRTKNPHVVFYGWRFGKGFDVETVDTGIGPREVGRRKREELNDRKLRAEDSDDDVLIVYSGRLGEDLRYVETV